MEFDSKRKEKKPATVRFAMCALRKRKILKMLRCVLYVFFYSIWIQKPIRLRLFAYFLANVCVCAQYRIAQGTLSFSLCLSISHTQRHKHTLSQCVKIAFFCSTFERNFHFVTAPEIATEKKWTETSNGTERDEMKQNTIKKHS